MQEIKNEIKLNELESVNNARDKEIEYLAIEDLTPYENNARTHDEYQIEKLKNSLKEFGFINPVIIDENNMILVGHGRIMGAKELGIETIPCIRIKYLTEEQKKAYILADNKLSDLGGWDLDLLNEELATIELDMSMFGFDEIELDDIEEEQEIVEDEVPEVPEEPKAKLGDIYQLGNHRLMCGDSTSEEDVNKLMNGVKADMVFTDPPYGINIDNSNGKILGDGDLSVFNNSLKTINEFAKEDAHLYIYFGVQFIKECIEELKKYFKQTNILIQHITHENKPSPKGYFKNNYEMCYFSNRKDKDFNYGLYDVSETTLEDKRYNGDGKLNAYKALTEIKATEHNLKAIHPTQKTINICAFYINISSNSDEIILDLFGGSGSTLIACEQLNRKCYMMELDPHYIDVIIQRWENFTGQKAKKIN